MQTSQISLSAISVDIIFILYLVSQPPIHYLLVKFAINVGNCFFFFFRIYHYMANEDFYYPFTFSSNHL